MWYWLLVMLLLLLLLLLTPLDEVNVLRVIYIITKVAFHLIGIIVMLKRLLSTKTFVHRLASILNMRNFHLYRIKCSRLGRTNTAKTSITSLALVGVANLFKLRFDAFCFCNKGRFTLDLFNCCFPAKFSGWFARVI